MRDTGEDVGHIECLVAVVSGGEGVRARAGGVDTAVVPPVHRAGQRPHGLLGSHGDLLLIRGELQVLAWSGTVISERNITVKCMI